MSLLSAYSDHALRVAQKKKTIKHIAQKPNEHISQKAHCSICPLSLVENYFHNYKNKRIFLNKQKFL